MEKDKHISLSGSYIHIEVEEKRIYTIHRYFIRKNKHGNIHKIITQNSCKNNEKEF